MTMDSHYKRARIIFDGYISEYKDVIYLYTAVPEGFDAQSHADTQAGAVYLHKENLNLTVDYASVRDPKVRDPYAPPALEDGYGDPDSADYAYEREDEDDDEA
jgi:hypothetical protein